MALQTFDPRSTALAAWANTWTAGYGIDDGPLHLRFATQFSLGLLYDGSSEAPTFFGWSPVAMTASATDLIDEKLTAIRMTPTVGFTIPTHDFQTSPVTTLSFGLQIERRFGPVELALYSRAAKPIVAGQTGTILCRLGDCRLPPSSDWRWANGFLGEWWILPALSVGLGLEWGLRFRELSYVGVPLNPDLRQYSVYVVHSTTGRAFISWLFHPLVGATFETVSTQTHAPSFAGSAVQLPFFTFGPRAGSTTTFYLSVWFRTLPGLEPRWLEL